MKTWQQLLASYPDQGTADSIQYELHQVYDDPALPVDVLLHYDSDGALAAVLEHFPQDIPTKQRLGQPLERSGNISIWVRADLDFNTAAMPVTKEAFRRWSDIDPEREKESYTAFGKDLYRLWVETYPEWQQGLPFDAVAVDASRASQDTS